MKQTTNPGALAFERCRKYRNPSLAQQAADMQQPYSVPVILGDSDDDGGIYLVPATNRDASLLLKYGYELCDFRAPVNEDMW